MSTMTRKSAAKKSGRASASPNLDALGKRLDEQMGEKKPKVNIFGLAGSLQLVLFSFKPSLSTPV